MLISVHKYLKIILLHSLVLHLGCNICSNCEVSVTFLLPSQTSQWGAEGYCGSLALWGKIERDLDIMAFAVLLNNNNIVAFPFYKQLQQLSQDSFYFL